MGGAAGQEACFPGGGRWAADAGDDVDTSGDVVTDAEARQAEKRTRGDDLQVVAVAEPVRPGGVIILAGPHGVVDSVLGDGSERTVDDGGCGDSFGNANESCNACPADYGAWATAEALGVIRQDVDCTCSATPCV